MTTLSDETQSVLDVLAEIRRTQSQTVDRMTEDWRHAMHLGVRVDKLGQRVSKLRAAVPSDTASAQVAGFRRDIKEFRADVAGFKVYIGELVNKTDSVNADMASIKSKLDILLTRFEDSDI